MSPSPSFVVLAVPCTRAYPHSFSQYATSLRPSLKSPAVVSRPTTFLPFLSSPPLSSSSSSSTTTVVSITSQQHQQDAQQHDEDGSSMPKFKFDPNNLESNAFGRDPKKETDFWRESARDLLASDEMQDAIAKFTAENPDNLTDEQRAYKEFIRQMDEGDNNQQ